MVVINRWRGRGPVAFFAFRTESSITRGRYSVAGRRRATQRCVQGAVLQGHYDQRESNYRKFDDRRDCRIGYRRGSTNEAVDVFPEHEREYRHWQEGEIQPQNSVEAGVMHQWARLLSVPGARLHVVPGFLHYAVYSELSFQVQRIAATTAITCANFSLPPR